MEEIPHEDQIRESKICSLLDSLEISYEKYYHPKLMKVSDAHELQIPGASIKNLFLKDKNNNYFLVTALSQAKINFNFLENEINSKKLRFASEESLSQILGINPGCVTPLAIFQDKNNLVTLIMDSDIKDVDNISLHPLHNYCSFLMKVKDLITFIDYTMHSISWVNFNQNDNKDLSSKIESFTDETISIPNFNSKKEKILDVSTLGLQYKKTENFTEWYTQVITKSEMIEYYDISGCYIIRPWAFYPWEILQAFFDKEIKKLGVENCNFPLFVTRAKLEAEKDHVEGFRPEVAWVTKYGDSDLSEPVAIRPTSETIMYPAYAKWIRSHRDLPLKLNQWNSVVRWEFKQPTPFLRSREFLWQEGHTAHTTEAEAYDFVLGILELYRRWYEEFLAVPVIKGIKSEKEKFSGGFVTTTIESYIQESGRGIQAATSHFLGTNFAKMFGIEFEDVNGIKQLCNQTSWGMSMRSLGVMVMAHGDDKGLVLPPLVARYQVIIIPITYKDNDNKQIIDLCTKIHKSLEDADIRSKIDERENYTPGWKYNHWDIKGVPLRIEIGPRDVKNNSFRIIRRDTNEKIDYQIDILVEKISSLLKTVQQELFQKAKQKLENGISKVNSFEEAVDAILKKKLVLVPWCEDPSTEDPIKKETQSLLQKASEDDSTLGMTGGMKCLCIPFEQPELSLDTKCFWTGKPAKSWSLWGRSY